MTKRVRKYTRSRLRSFVHAFNGIRILIKEERNAQLHVVSAFLVLLFGYFLKISHCEWIVVSTMIGLVFATEAMNAAIENLADYACKQEINPLIKKAKDLGAAAVLFVAIAAFVAACIIFIPKLINLFILN